MKKLTLCFSLFTLSSSLFTLSQAQIITTIAGSAAPNNVPATSIGMEIYGTIADKHGNIYVSDASNSVVRQVNLSTGIATIVAGNGLFGYSGDGGQALMASIESPADLGMDVAGNLYIGDLGGYGIRKVNISNGIITTIAGNGYTGFSGDGGQATAAELGNEPGIAFDLNNNLYIADFGNNRVRKVNAVTGIINTIAGTGTGGYNGDNIPATSAELYYPAGVCVDDSGNVYIAEQSNSRVRKINWKTGIITTYAGTGGFGYNGDNIPATSASLYCPLSVKLDTAGNLYIADWGNNRVREVNGSTGIMTTVVGDGWAGHSGDGGPATSAELTNSYTVALDTIGNLFVVEGFVTTSGSNRWIREINAPTQIITTIVGNGNSGNYTGDGIPATSAQLDNPSGVKVSAAGNIYIADPGNDRVREINSSVIYTFGGNGTTGYIDNVLADSAELDYPGGINLDKWGNMFIADTYNDRVREINLSDTMMDFAGNGYDSPYGGGFSGNGGQAIDAELYFPSGVAADDSGNIYIADTYNNRIRKVERTTGIITTFAGDGNGNYHGDGGKAIYAGIYYPSGLAVDDSGNVFIADTYNRRIRKVTASTGIISTVAGDGITGYSGDGGPATTAELDYPQGVTFDANGTLYIADTYNNRIRTVNLSTHIINTIAGNGVEGFSGDGGLAADAELNYPENMTIDASGDMYIADTYNNRIRKVTNVTGVNQLKVSSGQLSVYPNPSKGVFTISIKNYESEIINVSVYNVLGTKIYSASLQPQTPKGALSEMDLSNQPSGVYLYRVLKDDGSLAGEGKLIIVH